MRKETASFYRCPFTKETLALTIDHADGADICAGHLASAAGKCYPIIGGAPHLLDLVESAINDRERKEYNYYQAVSDIYDVGLQWLFDSFCEDEKAVRTQIVQRLELAPHHRVLEVGCGTCRDSVHIASQLDGKGALFVQDLSANMLEVGRRRIVASQAGLSDPCPVEAFVGNASYLPFADRSFDAAFHFGGLNLFTDKKQALAELSRVVRVGGKIVVGDESVAPWHRDTTYGNILINSNKLYQHTCPLECLPECARDVCVRWILGNAFYVIEFRVGEGSPKIDLDLSIPGKRGGTHRTRYFGTLEGVNLDTKDLAHQAAAQAGMSVHAWLDHAVRQVVQAERAKKPISFPQEKQSEVA